MTRDPLDELNEISDDVEELKQEAQELRGEVSDYNPPQLEDERPNHNSQSMERTDEMPPTRVSESVSDSHTSSEVSYEPDSVSADEIISESRSIKATGDAIEQHLDQNEEEIYDIFDTVSGYMESLDPVIDYMVSEFVEELVDSNKYDEIISEDQDQVQRTAEIIIDGMRQTYEILGNPRSEPDDKFPSSWNIE